MSQFYAGLTILFPDDRFNFTSGDMYYPNRNFNRYFNADCGTFFKSENEIHTNAVGTTTKKGALRNATHICATFDIVSD